MQSSKDDLENVLSALQDNLNKHFGVGAATRLSDQDALSKISSWTSTRSIIVDSVLRGGRPVGSSLLPFGRQIEISGLPGSGKTTLCAQTAAEVQSNGGIVIVTDTEERIDEAYWTALGVDVSRVIRVAAENLETVFDKQYKALQFAKNKAGGRKVLLIWDSLGGTAGAKAIDPKSPDSPMEQASKFGMRRAKIISDGMELVNTVVANTNSCYLYTNHEYIDINVKYGDKRRTRGGEKPKYFSTVRIRLSNIGAIKEPDVQEKDKIIGHRIRVKALKNSMVGILMERDAAIIAGRGFVNEYTVFEMAPKIGLIEKNGSWSTWTTSKGEEIKFQGFAGFEEKVVKHKNYKKLLKQVTEAL